ncbi:MAG: redoxin domain-containing protein [Acidobacteriota bacterium]
MTTSTRARTTLMWAFSPLLLLAALVLSVVAVDGDTPPSGEQARHHGQHDESGAHGHSAESDDHPPRARGQSAERDLLQVADLIGLRLQTVDGEAVNLGLGSGARPVAVVFLDDGCTISRRYVPRLNELGEAASEAGVELYAAISNPAITWQEARAFRDEFRLAIPLLFDFNGEVAHQLKPEVVPSAFVVDLAGRVVYSGRIDDRFPSLTKVRNTIRSHDLLRAIEGVGGDQPVEPRHTVAVGCYFRPWPEPEAKPTYRDHIAPILNANCAQCHSQGGVAPFALDSYDSARRWSRMAAAVTRAGLMPPWHAVRGQGHFREERFLTSRQLDLLEAWDQAGAPRGESAKELPAPTFETSEWPLGEPDLVLTMADTYEVPADGADIYRYFVLPLGLLRDQVVVAMDFQPGDPSVVHHCNFFVDYSGRAREFDSRDPEPGFSVFGTGGFMSYDGANALGAWAPGVGPYRLPEGRGFDLPRGGDVVLEVHYHPTGKAARDQSSIAFYFAKGPVKRGVSGLMVGTLDVEVPAGDAAYWRKVSMDVPADMQLVDIAPHMHYLGREARVLAVLPNGIERPLLHVDDWDLRWQGIYTYRSPVDIPAGSRIEASFRFDNSRQNPANPNSPPKTAKWGWGSDEEMAEIYLTIISDDPQATAELHRAARRSWTRSADPEAAAPQDRSARQWLDLLLQKDPWSATGEQVLEEFLTSPQFTETLDLTRREAKRKKNPDLYALEGVLLSLASYYGEGAAEQWRLGEAADAALSRALRADRRHGGALLARAMLYAESGDDALARRSEGWFQRLLDPAKSDPSEAQRATAFQALGKLYENLGEAAKAARTWHRGHCQFPQHEALRRLSEEAGIEGPVSCGEESR